LVGRTAYFFFAVFFTAFLAAFFAGAFFAAFLVAICLFSLFDGLHRFCKCFIAVEECIESLSIDVKKKTTDEWKNKQQFFPDTFYFELTLSKIFVLKFNFEVHESTRERKIMRVRRSLDAPSHSINLHALNREFQNLSALPRSIR
jgi:hypothetical protein